MHGALSDTQQHEIIERFSLSDSPVRVLLTGDVASEGVNMHQQCHHLIHYDLPWSLIRIEQRNGRIDRYGQVHQPEFAALILTSQTEGAKDDTTVAEKLLAREATAHSQLGTAEGVTRQFTSKKEEDRLVKDLLAGKTVDESIDAADGADPAADFLADLLAGVGDQPENPAPDQARVPRLFEATEAFARAALGAAAPELRVDDDGEMLAFRPPDDLVQRLSVLPPSYLKMHDITERMRVTFSRTLAQKNLDEAQRTKTLWPEIAYLSDLHPMIEWLTDKVLLRVPRQQAPVLIAAVDEPAFLVQGVYSNALGQPTVVEWMAVTGLPGEPRVDDMADALQRAKVGPDMVNTLRFGDIARLQDLVPAAVGAARDHLEARRASYDATIDGPIEEYRTRLATWEQLSLDGLLPAERGKREKVRETAGELGRLTEALRTAGEPLLRVLAVLTPRPAREERAMSYDSITNRGDYLSPHYLAEVLPRDLKKQGSLRTRWADREKAAQPTPVRGLRGLRREYFDARLSLKERADADQLRNKEMTELNGALLRALGFPAEPRDLAVERAGEAFQVPVAYAGQNVLAIDCDWAADTDAAFDADGPGKLLSAGRGRQPGADRDRREARPLAVRRRRAAPVRPAAARRRDRPGRPAHLGRRQVPGRQPGRRAGTGRRGRAGADRRPVQRRRAPAPRRRRRRAPRRLRGRLPPARRRRLRRAARGPARVRADHRQRGPGPAARAGRPARRHRRRHPGQGTWAASRCASCTGSCSCCTPRPGRNSASCPSTTRTTSPGTPWPASATSSPAASAARRRARASTCMSPSPCCSAW